MQGVKPSRKDGGVGVNTTLTLTAIEETIDVLLRHESLLCLAGTIQHLAGDGFIELGWGVLPISVGVDGTENVRDVSSSRSQYSAFLLLVPPSLVLFMHHNDYYYNGCHPITHPLKHIPHNKTP
jgi:hypothetical protein